MEQDAPPAEIKPRRMPHLFTAEDAAKGRAARKAKAEARKLARLTAPIREYRPEFPSVQNDASKAVVGHILADEITWRSELLSLLGEFRSVLLADIRGRLYDTEKVTLPALVREARGLIQDELRIIETTKSLDPERLKRGQVADLYAREALIREQLRSRGLMDQDGKLLPVKRTTESAPSVPADTQAEAEPAPQGVS